MISLPSIRIRDFRVSQFVKSSPTIILPLHFVVINRSKELVTRSRTCSEKIQGVVFFGYFQRAHAMLEKIKNDNEKVHCNDVVAYLQIKCISISTTDKTTIGNFTCFQFYD